MAKFATSISCMDGRIQQPIADWIRSNHAADYVDTITEPGVDRLMSGGGDLGPVKRKVDISINAHKSSLIVVSGHHDCAGNPVSEEEHIGQIRDGVLAVRAWGYDVPVVGVWVGSDWAVQKVA